MAGMYAHDFPAIAGANLRCRLRRWGAVFILSFAALSVADTPDLSPVAGSRDFDAGFLFSRDTTLEGISRTRALGPFFESQGETGGYEFDAVRPFFSSLRDPDRDLELYDLLWPLGTARLDRDSVSWRFLLAYGKDSDVEDPDSQYRVTILPLLFWGRDWQKEPYFALFPLGGSIHEYLFCDRIDFVLFPLYLKRTNHGVETRSIAWPLISWTQGDEQSQIRLFPLYGRSEKKDKGWKEFIAWPFWTRAHYEAAAGSAGDAWMLFPVCGRVRLDNQSTWMFLPPIFRWSRYEGGSETLCPWPFVRLADGKETVRYFWPLWGNRTGVGVDSSFFLWPLGSAECMERPEETVRRVKLLPFYWQEERQSKRPAAPAPATDFSGDSSQYVQIWPLGSYRREGSTQRLRLLDLWPGKTDLPVERNLAPFWTLFSSTAVADRRQNELLWGLVRFGRKPAGESVFSVFPLLSYSQAPAKEDKSCSLLLGLIQYRREGLKRTLRLLHWADVDLPGAAPQEKSAGDASLPETGP